MKKLEKMSLANMEGKLTRQEMKTIMAGSGYDSLWGAIYYAAEKLAPYVWADYQSRSGGSYSASGRYASMGPY